MWVGLLVWWTSAWALDATCEDWYDVNHLVDGMNTVEDLFLLERFDEAQETLSVMYISLPCTLDRLHPAHVARFARLQTISAFHRKDDLELNRWERLARTWDVQWPESYGPEHAVREAAAYVPDVELAEPPGQVVRPPSGGGVLLDGRLLRKPKASVETPHFVQIVDKEGWVESAYWQEGGVFRPQWTVMGDKAPAVAKWYRPPSETFDATQRVYIPPDVREVRAKQRRQFERTLGKRSRAQERVSELQEERAVRRLDESVGVSSGPRGSDVRAADTEDVAAPSEWVGIQIDALSSINSERRADLQLVCDDHDGLLRSALKGQLQGGEVRCLEESLRHERRMTRKVIFSRILIADAHAKEETHRWEGAVRRHLDELDRSDPELSYLYARYLAGRGADYTTDAIKWSGVALRSAGNWEGVGRAARMADLHRIQTVGAYQMWVAQEQIFQETGVASAHEEAGFWRSQTKSLAREWLDFSAATEQRADLARVICTSAAASIRYCDRG
jgi:hypothetical protein